MRSKVKSFFRSIKFNRPALIESGKVVFAIIGIGTILADFSTMKLWFLIPGLLLFSGVWFALYSQMEGVQ